MAWLWLLFPLVVLIELLFSFASIFFLNFISAFYRVIVRKYAKTMTCYAREYSVKNHHFITICTRQSKMAEWRFLRCVSGSKAERPFGFFCTEESVRCADFR